MAWSGGVITSNKFSAWIRNWRRLADDATDEWRQRMRAQMWEAVVAADECGELEERTGEAAMAQ